MLTDTDKLELRTMFMEVLNEAFSRRGLGADNEAELKELQANQIWVTERRKAWQDAAKTIRRAVVKGGLIGLASLVLWALTHPWQFVAWVAHVLSRTQ